VEKLDNRRDAEIDAFLSEIGYEEGDGNEIVRRGARAEGELSKREMKRRAKTAKRETKGKRPKKKKSKKKIALVVIGCFLLVGGIGSFLGWSWIRDRICEMTVGVCDFGFGDVWNLITGNEESLTPLKSDENGRTNVLVFGTGGDGYEELNSGDLLADSIIVVSIHQETGDVAMFSIPRDLKMRRGCTAIAKMNEGYWCSFRRNQDEEEAADDFKQLIGEIVGLELHYFVHLNWGGLIGIVDALGGIDIAIEYQGNKDTHEGDLPVIWTTDRRGIQDRNWDWACRNQCWFVRYANGTVQHLDGVHAIALARARGQAGPAFGTNGNWSREQNQQAIIEAVLLKARQTNFITDLNASIGLIEALSSNMRMNFQPNEYRTLFRLASDIEMSDIRRIDLQPVFRTALLPVPGVNSMECGGPSPGCLSYVLPRRGNYDYTELQALIRRELSNDPSVREGAIIDVLNGSGVSGVARAQANRVEGRGLEVGRVGDAGRRDFTGLTIVVLNSEMSGTRRILEQLFSGAEVVEGPLDGVSSTADFVLVVGSGAE